MEVEEEEVISRIFPQYLVCFLVPLCVCVCVFVRVCVCLMDYCAVHMRCIFSPTSGSERGNQDLVGGEGGIKTPQPCSDT